MTCIVGTKYMFFFVLFYKCVNGVILLWEKKPCSTSYSHTFVKIRCTNEVCFLLSVFSTLIALSSPYLYIRSFSGVIGWNDKLKWIVCAIKYDVNTHTTPSSKYIKKTRQLLVIHSSNGAHLFAPHLLLLLLLFGRLHYFVGQCFTMMNSQISDSFSRSNCSHRATKELMLCICLDWCVGAAISIVFRHSHMKSLFLHHLAHDKYFTFRFFFEITQKNAFLIHSIGISHRIRRGFQWALA